MIEPLVAERQIDVGLIVLPVDQSIFNIYSFIIDEFLVYILSDHPLAKREFVVLSGLKDEQFITFFFHLT